MACGVSASWLNVPIEGDVGIEVGVGDADLRGGRVQLGFGFQDIRPLMHQAEGMLIGSSVGRAPEWTSKSGASKSDGALPTSTAMAWRAAASRCRWAGMAAGVVRQLLPRGQDIGVAGSTDGPRLDDHVQILAVGVGDGLQRGDLDVGVGHGQRLFDHLARQGQVGRVQLAGLGLGLRAQGFAKPALAAEQVEIVADRPADRIEIELRDWSGSRGRRWARRRRRKRRPGWRAGACSRRWRRRSGGRPGRPGRRSPRPDGRAPEPGSGCPRSPGASACPAPATGTASTSRPAPCRRHPSSARPCWRCRPAANSRG